MKKNIFPSSWISFNTPVCPAKHISSFPNPAHKRWKMTRHYLIEWRNFQFLCTASLHELSAGSGFLLALEANKNPLPAESLFQILSNRSFPSANFKRSWRFDKGPFLPLNYDAMTIAHTKPFSEVILGLSLVSNIWSERNYYRCNLNLAQSW